MIDQPTMLENGIYVFNISGQVMSFINGVDIDPISFKPFEYIDEIKINDKYINYRLFKYNLTESGKDVEFPYFIKQLRDHYPCAIVLGTQFQAVLYPEHVFVPIFHPEIKSKYYNDRFLKI